jgi:hypothetical protein
MALPFHDHGSRRGWGISVTPRPLFTPEKDPVSIIQEAGWAPEPDWTGEENLAPPPGFDPRTVQPVASHYTNWATRSTQSKEEACKLCTLRCSARLCQGVLYVHDILRLRNARVNVILIAYEKYGISWADFHESYKCLIALFTHLMWQDNIKADIKEIQRVACARLIWLRIQTSDGCCEHGGEPLGSMMCGELLTWLRNTYISKECFSCMTVDCVNNSY